MKECPICKSDVPVDALKCRYCRSTFSSGHAIDALDANRQVTYVFDRGLIRFGKFTIAILAIFLIVGTYAFGFKLEDMLKKASEVQAKLASAQKELNTAQLELETAKRTVEGLKSEVKLVLDQAKADLRVITTHRLTVIEITNTMRELNDNQKKQFKTVKANPSKGVRTDAKSGNLWEPGTVIRIGFIGGSPTQREKVKRVAVEWTKHANIKFEFSDTGKTVVRVGFEALGGSWSYLGTQSLVVPDGEPTMNLGWLGETKEILDFERSLILHEFGHVLGLVEEHLNPQANLPWNRESVVQRLSGAPNFWSQATIEHYMFRKLKQDELSNYRAFDPSSVMNMTLPESFFTKKITVRRGLVLSESDKRLIEKLYPR